MSVLDGMSWPVTSGGTGSPEVAVWDAGAGVFVGEFGFHEARAFVDEAYAAAEREMRPLPRLSLVRVVSSPGGRDSR